MKRFSTLMISLALFVGCGLPDQAGMPKAVSSEAPSLAEATTIATPFASDDTPQIEQPLASPAEPSSSSARCALEQLAPCNGGYTCAWKCCGDDIEYTAWPVACGWCQSTAREHCGNGNVRKVYWK